MLRKDKIGCHIGVLFLSAILFADDVCLLAPTRLALQRMIDNCSSYCSRYGLSFNSKKSKIMIFDKRAVDVASVKPILLNGDVIEVVSRIKYLGTTITSTPSFNFMAEPDLHSFYRSANSVLNVLKKPDETVLMQLLYSNCVPTLTYACAVKEFSAREMADCNTAINNAIRRIFSFHRWESTRSLREGLGYPSLFDIFAKARDKFVKSLSHHGNSIVSSLYRINVLDRT